MFMNVKDFLVLMNYVYDRLTEKWPVVNPIDVGWGYHTATILNNERILVALSVGSSYLSVNTAQLYDLWTNWWTSASIMKKAKLYYDTTLLLNESVFLIDHLESFILYTQRTDVWSTSTKIIIARALCTEYTL